MAANPKFDIEDPAWLAHRYARVGDQIVFRYLPRGGHAAIPFLTDEYLADAPTHHMARTDAVALARGLGATPHCILHSAFCASTLLVRAMDHAGLAMGLSEPVILNDIVGIRRRGEMAGPELARLIDDALLLLGRNWADGERVIIKPSNIWNSLAPATLQLRGDAQALLLHTGLRQFLGSVARKGLWCRLWARELVEGQLRDGMVKLGLDAQAMFRLSDLQVAAVGWLAQHQLFAEMAGQFGRARVATLNAEDLLADRQATLAKLLDHFAMAGGRELAGQLANGPAFTRHSKFGSSFDAAARVEERRLSEATHGEEIAMVEQWAAAVAANAGIEMLLPAAL
ncbi:MAG: hypothetical protein IT553_10195 [Sphingomonadaceae bacterium]|nr:hypothetical protein [Sphingomonadaceae bacterium]